jgi:hypothetical protein
LIKERNVPVKQHVRMLALFILMFLVTSSLLRRGSFSRLISLYGIQILSQRPLAEFAMLLARKPVIEGSLMNLWLSVISKGLLPIK